MVTARLLSQFILVCFLLPVADAVNGQSQMPSPVVREWKSKFAKPQEVHAWNKEYENPYNSWFGDSEEVASKWHLFFGPLGIKVHAHDFTWGNLKAFKNRFPSLLTDKNGELLVNAFEVLHVIPGAPAEGHLKPGDLLIEMEGRPFMTASALRHKDGPYQFQERRSLEMHAGELLDAAEGKGKVSFKIIRPSEITTPPDKADSLWETVAEASMMDDEGRKKGIQVNVSLREGELCRLIVDDGGNNHHYDGFTWEDMVLVSDSGKTISMHELLPLVYDTGYGGLHVDKEKNAWGAHAPSQIMIQIPEGKWTLKGKGVPSGSATVGVKVEKCPGMLLPASMQSLAKSVSFSIPQIGSYATDGMGKNSRKTKNVVDMTAAWLAAQQKEDGSWTRPAGYTKAHYDTAIAGLGLMATGNPEFTPNIKKGAEFIAFSGTKDWWGVPLSTATIFLCEYWLKYKDDRVLPAIRNSVHRLLNEMLYGDYVSGHGVHPGYRGTGVSVGGSHMALALALAAKTPVAFDRPVIDKMLARAQEISPSGFSPYGRTAENLSLEPSLENGATYSGRNGPYLIASLIHGGPAGFIRNCSALYSHGRLGGADQGHSTETLTLLWAFPASASVGLPTYYRQMNSFLWKLTMLRTFDGAFCFNANRMEYQGAEGVLNVYIRTGTWLLGLCADRQNLAITGHPGYRAKSFKNVPLVSDPDARILGTYKRNWAIVQAALGNKAPAGLKQTLSKINAIPAKPGCREALFKVVGPAALPVAREILSIPGEDPVTLAYYAEIILGVDTRISMEIKSEDDQKSEGHYDYVVTVQEPFFGRSLGLRGEEEKESKKPLIPFSGSIVIEDSEKQFKGWEDFTFDNGTDSFNNWNSLEKKLALTSSVPSDKEVALTARIKYRIGDLDLEYLRPIAVNKPEPGNGEKGRKITNDRRILVPGIIARDHGKWGMSFKLPNGTFVSAATQGNEVTVREGKGEAEKTWISSTTRSLTADSKCQLLCTTGWDGLELRVAEARLLQHGAPPVRIKQLTANGKSLSLKELEDYNPATDIEVSSNEKGELELIVTLGSLTAVKGLDLRASDGPHDMKAVIAVENSRKWKEVHWTTFLRNDGALFEFQPERTDKIRIILSRNEKFNMKLSELGIYQALPPKKEIPSKSDNSSLAAGS